MLEQTARPKIFFLGGGSMSEAMIKGLLAARLLSAEQITISNRKNNARLETLHRRYGVHICQDKLTESAQADVLILAMKPFDLAAALREIAPSISSHHLLISVAAGISTTTIERQLLNATVPVVRAMPNTSSSVQASATAICAGQHVTPEQLELAQHLFSAIGISVVVDEDQMNAVTGLSGSGPAYFYYVVEALLEAGQRCGLSAATSRTLLVQTLYGSARMLQETGQDPAELRRQVTSPNGTTMAALTALDQAGTPQLFIDAVQRATARAAEMGLQADASATIGASTSSTSTGQ